MGSLVAVGVWIIFGVCFAGIIAYAFYAERKRREAVQQFAVELGLEYQAQLSLEDQSDFDGYALAKRGRGQKPSNVIVADSGALRMVIFDYQYTSGSGKNKTTHRQSVVLARSSELNLPQFTMTPETIFHRLAEFLGKKDIDFQDDEQFSRSFLLHGSDEAAIRSFFNKARREKFLEDKQLSIEGCGTSFIFYQARKRLNPSELKTLMAQAIAIYATLSA